jgi:hypothetical protein
MKGAQHEHKFKKAKLRTKSNLKTKPPQAFALEKNVLHEVPPNPQIKIIEGTP